MSNRGFWRAVTQDRRNVTLTGFGQQGRIWYVYPQGGNDAPRGAFTSMTTLFNSGVLRSRDTIMLAGVLREQCVAPLNVYDVAIIGVANRPRQATSGGVPTGGGACWLAPASGAVAATPLLQLRAQGWYIANIEFTPHTNSAGIRLTRSATVDTIDAGHAIIEDCLFAANGGAGQIGIEDNGGCGFCLVQNNRFQSLTGTALLGLSTAAAVPRDWDIRMNRFNGNTNAIAMSLTESLVFKNFIRQTANDANNKVNLIALAGQGSLNQVIDNIFPDTDANVTIAKGYKPGTTDVWRNYVTNVAAYIVTVPA